MESIQQNFIANSDGGVPICAYISPSNKTNSFCGDIFDLSESDKLLISQLSAPVPSNENERVKVLRESRLLDSDTSDPAFDRFTFLCQRLFEVPISLVSLVDVSRQWFKSKCGLDAPETHRNVAFCAYTVLPESSEVFVVENSLVHPVFKDYGTVTGPPNVVFYAGAALIVDGVRVGSLCVIDHKPRSFSMKDRMNLMDLGSAVAELIAERRRTFLNHNQERSSMMLSMMQGIRTPLFAVDLGMSVLQAEKDAIREQLERNGGQHASKTFVSTIDDIYASTQRLKMAVESTVIIGKAFSMSWGSRSAVSDSMISQQPIMGNAAVFDVDTCMSQMKMVGSIMSGQRVEWDNLSFDPALSEVLSDKRNIVKSFPDGINFFLLTVLNHILSFDLSRHPINISITSTRCCVDSNLHSDASKKRSNSALAKMECSADDFCYVCDSSSSTVSEQHGYIILQIKTRSVRADFTSPSDICGTENTDLVLGILTLQNALAKVLDNIGGKFRVETITEPAAARSTSVATDETGFLAIDVPGHRVDIFECSLPYLVQHTDKGSTSKIGTSRDTPVSGSSRAETPTSSLPGDSKAKTIDSSQNQMAIALLNRHESFGNITEDSLHVLIVDDSLLIQKMMKKWLESLGCIVSCAINGKVGLSMIQNNKYDIMLLDFLMPVLGGLDTLQQYTEWIAAECQATLSNKCGGNSSKSNTKHVNRDMLIIGMSSTACEEEQRCGFQNGMHFFSPKPVELDSLKKALMIKKTHLTIESCVEAIIKEVFESGMINGFPGQLLESDVTNTPVTQPTSVATSSDNQDDTVLSSNSICSNSIDTSFLDKGVSKDVIVKIDVTTKDSKRAFGNWSFFKKHAKVSPSA